MSGASARIATAIAVLLASLAPRTLPAQAVVRPSERPFLYRIEGAPPSYLYGTIHLPDDRVLALSRAVRLALERAEVLVTELPLDGPAQRALEESLRLPAGQTLSDVLPAALHARLEAYLARRGLELEPLERLKVLVVGAQLEALDYAGVTRPPLDAYLVQLARARGKALDALESPEEQVAALDAFSVAEQIALLDQSLAQLERQAPGSPGAAERMVRAYLAGDEEALWSESLAHHDPDDPTHRKFLEVVIVRRNARFAGRIETRLARAPARSCFVAVGALHLFGPEGVIARLEKRGRTLRRLDGRDDPQPPTPRDRGTLRRAWPTSSSTAPRTAPGAGNR